MVVAFVIILVAMPVKTKDPRKAELKEAPSTTTGNRTTFVLSLISSLISSLFLLFLLLDKSLFNLKAIFLLLAIPEVFYLIGVKTLVGIPAGIFHSMFSIVNMEKFDLSPEVNGYILTYIGLLTAVSSQTTDIEIAYFEIACIIIFCMHRLTWCVFVCKCEHAYRMLSACF